MTAAFLAGVLAPLAFADPGPTVRIAYPLIRVVGDVSAATTVGLLILAAFVMPERRDTRRRRYAGRLAAVFAGVWFLSGAAITYFTFASLAGLPLESPELGQQFVQFFWELAPTRVLAISTGVAALVAVCSMWARTRTAYAIGSVLALVGIVIVALTGHAAGAVNHESAVNSLAVHLIGASLWLGVLCAIGLMRPLLGSDLEVTVRRFSVLAGWAYAAVALSGLQQAVLRLGSWAGLNSPYGTMLILKMVLLIVLGLLGWQQRRVVIDSISRGSRGFTRLVFIELALMATAFGLGAALSRTPPPTSEAPPDAGPIQALTGFPDPGPLTAADWLFAWRPNWLMLTISVFGVAMYAVGVRRLRRCGRTWPAHRTALWVAGWAIFAWATSGAPDIWGRVLFSMHLVMHLSVALVVPLFLVAAAPITLALKVIAPRDDLTWGTREVIVQIAGSQLIRVLSNPLIAVTMSVGGLLVFYRTPLFEISLNTHTGHLLMLGYGLGSGALFVSAVNRGASTLVRALSVLFAAVIVAGFGWHLRSSSSVLAAGFYEQFSLEWAASPLKDQQQSASIMWLIGALVIAVLIASAAGTKLDTGGRERRSEDAGRAGSSRL